MSIQGYYYLHRNGALIYKPGADPSDLRESDLVRGLWPFDPADRECAWRTLVEARASGADVARVEELAAKWGCNDEDAQVYAERVGVNLSMDGDQWCATCGDFMNLAESPAGFGPSCLVAMAELAKDLEYVPSKMWGATFADLVNGTRGAQEASRD